MATPRKLTPLFAARNVARIGELLQQMADRQARQDAQIARAKRRWDAAKAKKVADDTRAQARIDKLARPLWQFFSANRSEGAKSLAVGTGKLATVTRKQGATIKHASDEAIAAEILKKHPELYAELVKVTVTINLNPLRKRAEELADLTTIEIPGVETLSIEPANTELKFRRPIPWFSPQEN